MDAKPLDPACSGSTGSLNPEPCYILNLEGLGLRAIVVNGFYFVLYEDPTEDHMAMSNPASYQDC